MKRKRKTHIVDYLKRHGRGSLTQLSDKVGIGPPGLHKMANSGREVYVIEYTGGLIELEEIKLVASSAA